MGKRKLPWQYSNTQNMRCGRMICTACGKTITEGDYRFREAFDDRGFHSHSHRACIPEAEQNFWLKQEADSEAQKQHQILYREACKEFARVWNTSDLDDVISELSCLE